MGSEMDTFTARLASFDTVLKPERRRSSTTKSSKPIAWPHQKPSPAELAHAGFYYKPYETNPDNTTCFECGRALDGWEEEDNPVTEHLKHSPDCGWAIIIDIQQKSSNPATIEDPTNERITQARLATFGSAWPHDGKRGWFCQSEKMVAGGWYFCPTDESDDLASCPYCKLSLDGWEPKDDPFDEHYRRSSDCSFFVFAQPPGKKGRGSRAKKPRTSKASSRLSTQSVASVASDVPGIELDEAMDQSIISQSTSKAKSTKKSTKSKGKTAKNKKEDADAEGDMDLESTTLAQSEPHKPKRTGRGKKRVSEEMDDDEPVSVTTGEAEQIHDERPAKRRDTRTRESSLSEPPVGNNDTVMPDVVSEEKPSKKGRKGAKKRASNARKASDTPAESSVAKAQIPPDSELDAALDAELEDGIPDDTQPEPAPEVESEPVKAAATTKKPKGGKKAKASTKVAEPVIDDQEDLPEVSYHQTEEKMDVDHLDQEATEEPLKPKPKSSKKKGTKKSKKEEVKAKAPATEEPSKKNNTHEMEEHEPHDSFVSVEIVNHTQEHAQELEFNQVEEPEAEIEPAVESPDYATKKSSRKDEKHKKPKKAKKPESSPPREPEAQLEPEPEQEQEQEQEQVPGPEMETEMGPQPEMEAEVNPDSTVKPMDAETGRISPSVDDDFGTPDELPDQVEVGMAAPLSPEPRAPSSTKQKTPVPPKTAKRYSDIPQNEHYADRIRESQEPRDVHNTQEKSPTELLAPTPQRSNAHQNTPSLSPQSSDAENKPPSSRPSASRQAVPPVSMEPAARTPLAATIPSPSKRNFNGGFAASGHPWTPVDIDEALFGEASDKENADVSSLFKGIKGGLTSPEKKMTVEEWIHWNAKNGEERLKRECERLVGQFEKEGGRAMQRLEAIECSD